MESYYNTLPTATSTSDSQQHISTLQYTIDEQAQTIKDLESKLNNKQHTLQQSIYQQEQQYRIDSLLLSINSLEKQNNKLHKQLDKQQHNISALEYTIDEQAQTIEHLESNKQQQKQTSKQSIDQLEQQDTINNLLLSIKSLENQNNKLHKQLDKQQQQIKILESSYVLEKQGIIQYISSGYDELESISNQLGDHHQYNRIFIDYLSPCMTIVQELEFVAIEKCKSEKKLNENKIIVGELESTISKYRIELGCKNNYGDNNYDNEYSVDRISSLSKQLQTLKNNRDDLFVKFQKISIEICSLMTEQQVLPSFSRYTSLIYEMSTADIKSNAAPPIPFGDKKFSKLVQTRDQFLNIKLKFKDVITDICNQITIAYDELETPQEDMVSFVSNIKSLPFNSNTAQLCQKELERIEQLTSNLKVLASKIENIVIKIKEYYTELGLPIERLFKLALDYGLNSGHSTPSLLEFYKEELVQVGHLYESSKSIINKINTIKSIKTQKYKFDQELLERSRQRLFSNKFDSSNINGDQFKHNIFNQLPNLQLQLIKELKEYQIKCGEPFKHNGINYLEFIQKQQMKNNGIGANYNGNNNSNGSNKSSPIKVNGSATTLNNLPIKSNGSFTTTTPTSPYNSPKKVVPPTKTTANIKTATTNNSPIKSNGSFTTASPTSPYNSPKKAVSPTTVNIKAATVSPPSVRNSSFTTITSPNGSTPINIKQYKTPTRSKI